MKTKADENGGGDAGKQVWIWRRRRCGTATEVMCYDGDGEMSWKDSNELGKYQQGKTTNLRAYRRSYCLGLEAMMDLHAYFGFIWRLYLILKSLKNYPLMQVPILALR